MTFLMRIYLKTLPLAMIIAFVGCSRSPKKAMEFTDTRTVLRVGEYILTMADVDRKFYGVEYDDPHEEFEKKKQFVEKRLERFLQIEGAKAAGIVAEIDSSQIKKLLLGYLFYQDVSRNFEVTDKDVERFFKKYGGEIQFGHILVKDSALADSLYNALEDGAEYDYLARKYSLDEISKNRGGSVGYVTFGRYDKAIQGPAYELEFGEYTKPIRSRYGWHIVKLYDWIKHSKEDLKENWNSYRGMAAKYILGTKNDEYQAKVLADYKYRVNQDVIDLLIRKADSLHAIQSDTLDLPSSGYLKRSAFDDDELKLNMAEYDGGGVTVDEYLNLIQKYDPSKTPELRDKTLVNKIFKERVRQIVLLDHALKKGIDTLQAFVDDMKRQMENQLIKKLNEQLCSNLPPATDEEIEAYYNENIDDFHKPDQIRASAISVRSKKEADWLLERIKAGAKFESLARKYSTDKKTGIAGGDIGFFTIKRYTEIYKAAEDMEIDDIGGPVKMYGNYWIFKVTTRKKRVPRPINQVRGEISNRIWYKKRNAAIRTWIEGQVETAEYFIDLDLIRKDLGLAVGESEPEADES